MPEKKTPILVFVMFGVALILSGGHPVAGAQSVQQGGNAGLQEMTGPYDSGADGGDQVGRQEFEEQIAMIQQKEARLDQIKEALLKKIEEFQEEKRTWESRKQGAGAAVSAPAVRKPAGDGADLRAERENLNAEKRRLADLRAKLEHQRELLEGRLVQQKMAKEVGPSLPADRETAVAGDAGVQADKQLRVWQERVQDLNNRLQLKNAELIDLKQQMLDARKKADETGAARASELEKKDDGLEVRETALRKLEKGLTLEREQFENEKAQWAKDRKGRDQAQAGTDQKAVEKKEIDLALREAALAEGRAAFEAQKKAWSEKQQDAARGLQELELKEKQLGEATAKWQAEKKQWLSLQQELKTSYANREAQLRKGETELESRNRQLETRQRELQSQGNSLTLKVQKLEKAAQTQKSAEAAQAGLTEQSAKLRERIKELEAQKGQWEKKSVALEAKLTELAGRERALEEKSRKLDAERESWMVSQADRQAGSSRREQELNNRSAGIEKRSAELEQKLAAYEKQDALLKTREEKLAAAQDALVKKVQRLEENRNQVQMRDKAAQEQAAKFLDGQEELKREKELFMQEKEKWEAAKNQESSYLASQKRDVQEYERLVNGKFHDFNKQIAGWEKEKAAWDDQAKAREAQLTDRETKLKETAGTLERRLAQWSQERDGFEQKRKLWEDTAGKKESGWASKERVLTEQETLLKNKLAAFDEKARDWETRKLEGEKELVRVREDLKAKQAALTGRLAELDKAKEQYVYEKNLLDRKTSEWETRKNKEEGILVSQRNDAAVQEKLVDTRFSELKAKQAAFEKQQAAWPEQVRQTRDELTAKKNALESEIGKLQTVKDQMAAQRAAVEKLRTEVIQSQSQAASEIEAAREKIAGEQKALDARLSEFARQSQAWENTKKGWEAKAAADEQGIDAQKNQLVRSKEELLRMGKDFEEKKSSFQKQQNDWQALRQREQAALDARSAALDGREKQLEVNSRGLESRDAEWVKLKQAQEAEIKKGLDNLAAKRAELVSETDALARSMEKSNYDKNLFEKMRGEWEARKREEADLLAASKKDLKGQEKLVDTRFSELKQKTGDFDRQKAQFEQMRKDWESSNSSKAGILTAAVKQQLDGERKQFEAQRREWEAQRAKQDEALKLRERQLADSQKSLQSAKTAVVDPAVKQQLDGERKQFEAQRREWEAQRAKQDEALKLRERQLADAQKALDTRRLELEKKPAKPLAPKQAAVSEEIKNRMDAIQKEKEDLDQKRRQSEKIILDRITALEAREKASEDRIVEREAQSVRALAARQQVLDEREGQSDKVRQGLLEQIQAFRRLKETWLNEQTARRADLDARDKNLKLREQELSARMQSFESRNAEMMTAMTGSQQKISDLTREIETLRRGQSQPAAAAPAAKQPK